MKSDHELGMGKKITTRDFIHDAGFAGAGAFLAPGAIRAIGVSDLAYQAGISPWPWDRAATRALRAVQELSG